MTQAAQYVDKAIIDVMTNELDSLISACLNADGSTKAPDKKALMKARAMLPARSVNTLKTTSNSRPKHARTL